MFARLSHLSGNSPQNSRGIESSDNREDVRLIWFDDDMNESLDFPAIRTKLLELNPAAQLYRNILACENFIKTTDDENILLVISGAYAKHNLPKFSSMGSVRAIFIFSEDRQGHHDNQVQHSKVIGTFNNLKNLFNSIEKTMHSVEIQTYAFTLFNHKEKSTKDLSREGATFIWHQLLVHVLRQMSDDEYARTDMLKTCVDYYRHSPKELDNIERFRSTYSPATAIHWYTMDSFLCKLLNRAFRTENIELIYAFRYFIIDLCTQLEQESSKLEGNSSLTVYRGQQIPVGEFEELRKNVGKLIAPNGFFSASKDKEVSIMYAGQSSKEMTAVIFEILVDPSLRSVTVADIRKLSQFKDEHELLFSIGATFKIGSIAFNTNLNVLEVQLTSTDDGRDRIDEYFQLAEEEMKDMSPMIYFGSLLLYELGKVDYAEKYFHALLKTLPSDHRDIAAVKIGLGHVYTKRGDNRLALEKYQQAYEIRRNTLSIFNPGIAASLRNFGNTHRAMGNVDQALFYFREAMKINERNYSADHISVATTFEEIGLTFRDKAQWEIALVWLEDALEIFKRVLPPQHPQIAHCLGSIGNVHKDMQQFDRALEYLYQELEMDELCLPSEHCHINNDLDRIVDTYKAMHAYERGLRFCREKLAIYQELFGENHPRVIKALLGICSLLLEKSSIDQALETCQRALSITANITPTNVPITIECMEYISYIYQLQEDFDKSLTYREQQIELEKKIYPLNHSSIGRSFIFIGKLYHQMDCYTVALEHFNEALLIYEGIYPRSDDVIEMIREQIISTEKAQSHRRKLRRTSTTRFYSSSRSRSRSKSKYSSSSALRTDQQIATSLSLERLDLEASGKIPLKPKQKRNSRKK